MSEIIKSVKFLNRYAKVGRFSYDDGFDSKLVSGNKYSIKYDHSKYDNGTVYYSDDHTEPNILETILKNMDAQIITVTFRYYIEGNKSLFHISLRRQLREIKIKDILDE